MTFKQRRPVFIASLLALSLVSSASFLGAKSKKKPAETTPPQMDEAKRAVHLLNRLTFGPRPGDVEKVTAMGVDKWIDQQLRPDKIDDSALQSRLAPFRTLQMDARSMMESFPTPQVLKAVAYGRLPLPSDPQKRAIYEAGIANYKLRQDAKAAGDTNYAKNGDNKLGLGNGDGNNMEADNQDMKGDMKKGDREEMTPEARQRRAQRKEDLRYANLQVESLSQKSPQDRFNAIMKMAPEDRRAMFQGLSQEDRGKLAEGMSPEQREQLIALANPQGVIVSELAQGKILRAVYSERQLDEVMTDFWFNHFNVFVAKGPDRYLTTSYERDAIRKNALGKFKDLLMATAEHPAMLFYLDNFQSVGPNSPAGKNGGRGRGGKKFQTAFRPGFGGMMAKRNRMIFNNQAGNRPMRQDADNPAQNSNAKPKRGLNENYARELMELHTLGVDGGYTQQDIIEVAKVFTGWTINQPRLGGNFEFNDKLHEPGDKNVLGQRIKEDGQNEGKKVLELLARHPSTAKFVSRKMAMRFVSDNPPPALVDRMAETYLKSDGDIKEVLRTLFKSPEFWAPEAYRAKIKTPLEFVVSAIRVTGADVNNALPLAQALQKLGMPLYGMQPPTGYSMKAEAWVNSAALLNRMNFALGLGAGKLRGINVNSDALLRGSPPPNDADAAIAVLVNSLLSGDISQKTRDTIRQQLNDPSILQQAAGDADAARPRNMAVIAGLMLGSPEFQRR